MTLFRTRRLQAGQQVPELIITQHERIFDALASRDTALAEATSLLHIATTADGLRALLASEEGKQPGEARERVQPRK
ncbi:MAG TPA: FCD domain-containing protein [Trebonia sp.]|nr:FCD domain-containing protein [Trebonia sp.]